jgi:cation transporter-like permease
MKNRRRSLVLGATLTAILVGVVGVLIYDAVAGGVNRPLVLAIVVVMALVVGPLIGLFLSAPMEDGEVDDAVQRRAPSRN